MPTLTEPSETLAGLCRRVAALEGRLARKPPDNTGRRMTRLDRCPYGWKPHPHNPARLVEDGLEQKAVFALIEFRQDAAQSLRGLCRLLDLRGYKRRGGKTWAGAHSTVRAILKRHNAETPADASARVQERIAAMRRGR